MLIKKNDTELRICRLYMITLFYTISHGKLRLFMNDEKFKKNCESEKKTTIDVFFDIKKTLYQLFE